MPDAHGWQALDYDHPMHVAAADRLWFIRLGVFCDREHGAILARQDMIVNLLDFAAQRD